MRKRPAAGGINDLRSFLHALSSAKASFLTLSVLRIRDCLSMQSALIDAHLLTPQLWRLLGVESSYICGSVALAIKSSNTASHTRASDNGYTFSHRESDQIHAY